MQKYLLGEDSSEMKQHEPVQASMGKYGQVWPTGLKRPWRLRGRSLPPGLRCDGPVRDGRHFLSPLYPPRVHRVKEALA